MITSLLAKVGCIYLRKLSTSGILYIAKVSLLKHFRNFNSRKKHHVVVMYVQWRIQDFPQGGAPTPKSAVIFQFFPQKLHENERIWTPGGARVAPPLDPPMMWS